MLGYGTGGDSVTDSNREVWTTSIGDQHQALDDNDTPKQWDVHRGADRCCGIVAEPRMPCLVWGCAGVPSHELLLGRRLLTRSSGGDITDDVANTSRGGGMLHFSTSHSTGALHNNNCSFGLLCTIGVDGDTQLGLILSETDCRVCNRP